MVTSRKYEVFPRYFVITCSRSVSSYCTIFIYRKTGVINIEYVGLDPITMAYEVNMVLSNFAKGKLDILCDSDGDFEPGFDFDNVY